jgi:hypothetical protein
MKKNVWLLFLSTALCIATVAAKDNLAVLPFTGGGMGEGENCRAFFV